MNLKRAKELRKAARGIARALNIPMKTAYQVRVRKVDDEGNPVRVQLRVAPGCLRGLYHTGKREVYANRR